MATFVQGYTSTYLELIEMYQMNTVSTPCN